MLIIRTKNKKKNSSKSGVLFLKPGDENLLVKLCKLREGVIAVLEKQMHLIGDSNVNDLWHATVINTKYRKYGARNVEMKSILSTFGDIDIGKGSVCDAHLALCRFGSYEGKKEQTNWGAKRGFYFTDAQIPLAKRKREQETHN